MIREEYGHLFDDPFTLATKLLEDGFTDSDELDYLIDCVSNAMALDVKHEVTKAYELFFN